MPTIQIRTDEKTKNASAALFNQLGITMSEAINLFLRQVVMKGGIPFSLTVPEGQENNDKIGENELIIDALKRYKTINGKTEYNIIKTEPFLNAVQALDFKKDMRITLQENSVKIRLIYKDRNFILDYNFDEPDNVFILSKKNEKLIIKDCNLAKMSETLEHFQ